MDNLTLAGAPQRSHERTTDEADVSLVHRMASGDAEALGEFHDRWHSYVYVMVARRVSARNDRDDVIEAIFWQAWQVPRASNGRVAVFVRGYTQWRRAGRVARPRDATLAT